MIYKRPPLVEIIWIDAYSKSGWHDEGKWDHEVEHEYLVRSSGYLIAKTKAKYLLAMCLTCENTVGEIFSIPRGCVKNVREIEELKN